MSGKLVCKKEVCFNVIDNKSKKVLKGFETSCDVLFINNSKDKEQYREDVQVGQIGIATIWSLKKGFSAVFILPYEKRTFNNDKLYNRLDSSGDKTYIYKTINEAREDVLKAFEIWNVQLYYKFNKLCCVPNKKRS